MGFEPTRAEPIGLAVQRLNHSATSSCYTKQELDTIKIKKIIQNNKKLSHTGSLLGESQEAPAVRPYRTGFHNFKDS
jgi:hypothetical protein